MAASRLNIGAAITYIPGFDNIDISPNAQITLDLNTASLPYASDSIDLIFSYHTLEHLEQYVFALGEIHRVLRHGGKLLLGVPYATSTELNLINPYHKQLFSEDSFNFFDPERNKGGAGESNPILFTKVFHRCHYIGAFNLLPPMMRTWPRRHLMNVVKKIDFGLIAVKDPSQAINVTPDLRREMQMLFRDCLQARTPYDTDTRNFVAPDRSFFGKLRAWKRWWKGTGF